MDLDSSVLVKRYVQEPDSGHVDQVVVEAAIVSSGLAFGEVWAALLAKERARDISVAVRKLAWKAFQEDVQDGVLRLIPLDRCMICDANELMFRVHPHVPLRTLDAIYTNVR